MRRSGIVNRTLCVLWLSSGCIGAIAQVSNNNIKDRTELELNATPLHSNTNHSSVEWNCINKALTNECLVYHNDQWFSFKPKQSGKFFLNVSSQQCRDQRGIQVIVIEGNPCEISSYKILQCIPKIHQDDVFIELDSVKADVQYLVNIDGFLGDFCEFDIQLSTQPRGFPRVLDNADTLNMQFTLKESTVTIHWTVHESIAEEIRAFKIYRIGSESPKSTLIKELPLRANALGDFDKEYMLVDTLLKWGNYVYRVFGIQKEMEIPVLLDEQRVSFHAKSNPGVSTWAYIPLDLKNSERYMVLVFNKVDYSLLRKYTGEFDRSKDATFEINLQEFIRSGMKEFIIMASEANSNKAKEFHFRFDGTRMIGN